MRWRAPGLSNSGDLSPCRSGRLRGGAWGRAGALRRRLSARGRPPGHAEAAAAAARGSGAARSRARWPSVAQEGPGGSAGPGGRGVLRGDASPPAARAGVGSASDLPPRVPREAGSAWGATRPARREALARPGQRGGRVCEAGAGEVAGGLWIITAGLGKRSLLRAPHVHPGGRQDAPVCEQPGLFRARC